MSTVTSTQPWSQKIPNQSGIRRLKVVDANYILLLRSGLVPQLDFIFFEFIFPSDLSCVATTSRQVRESGSVHWNQSISFNLPHMSDEMVLWVADNPETLWIAIAEDYNGGARAFGGSYEGLKLGFQATTGAGPRDANPMGFTFSGEQLIPFKTLPAYDDHVLFPNGAGFSYGFSIGFNS